MSKQRAIIKRMEIKGLWGRQDFVLDFHDDLNILTGSNGSGKTTILKVLWYIISGNIHHLVNIFDFSEIKILLTYDQIEILFTLRAEAAKDRQFSKGKYPGEYYPAGTTVYRVRIEQKDSSAAQPVIQELDVHSQEVSSYMNPIKFPFSSYFLPTFRRIEGNISAYLNGSGENLINVYENIRDNLSTQNHRFIFFPDIRDIDVLLAFMNTQAAMASEAVEKEFDTYLSENLTNNTIDTKVLSQKLAEKEAKKEMLRSDLSMIGKLVDEFMLEKSIALWNGLIIGSHPVAVPIEALSWGEQNLLSTLVYAMTKPSLMFIDEPELGMHQSWQRRLIPILKEISPDTQYFLVTHASPVRAAYPDKQLFLDEQIMATAHEQAATK